MSNVEEIFNVQGEQARSAVAPIVGRLVSVDNQGQAKVDYPGNALGALDAKTIVTLPPSQAKEGQPLLLLFENNHPERPIIIGIVSDTLVVNANQNVSLPVGRPEGALVDGKKISFDARDEIFLQCGKSSILLRKDGKVVIKGKEILSRASGSNKLKGATININ